MSPNDFFLNKLEVVKLDIQDCSGQGFNNDANMAGKYQRLSEHILEISNLSIFVPYSAHNLNVAGAQPLSTTP